MLISDVEVLSADQVADFLGVDRKTVYDYANRDLMPHRKVGKRLFFNKLAIALWVAGDYAPYLARVLELTEFPKPTDDTDPDVMTAKDVGEWLGVSVATVFEATWHGTRSIPHRKLGKRVLFSRRAVTKWLAVMGGMRPKQAGRRQFPVD